MIFTNACSSTKEFTLDDAYKLLSKNSMPCTYENGVVSTMIPLSDGTLYGTQNTLVVSEMEAAFGTPSHSDLLQLCAFARDYKVVQEKHYISGDLYISISTVPMTNDTLMVSVHVEEAEPLYMEATKLLNEKKYSEAKDLFRKLNGYKDAKAQFDNVDNIKNENLYDDAISFAQKSDYRSAIQILRELNYKNSLEKLNEFLEIYYQEGVDKYLSQRYTDSMEIFCFLGSYQESEDYIYKIQKTLLKNVSVGDTIFWGKYEQNNNISDGTEPIEWIVLNKSETKILVISKYALDCQPYHNADQAVTWENSSIRNWLNTTFYDSAFPQKSQQTIVSTLIKTDNNGENGTYGGNSTYDKIFLLELGEVKHFFATSEKREVSITEYARFLSNPNAQLSMSSWWWTRTPGRTQKDAAMISPSGIIDTSGYTATMDFYVRPAMWIDISPTNE